MSRDQLSPVETVVGNGIYVDDGSYVVKPHPIGKFAEIVARDPLQPESKAPLAFFDAGNPAEVGWGLVTPQDIDPAVLEALEPLLAWRRHQAGELYKDLVVYEGSSVNRFLKDHGAVLAPPDPRRVPYYLLLVGGPEEISFEFQYLLDQQYAVGRLSFDTPEEYANYAAGVVACEAGEVGRRRRQVDLFGVRNWDDYNTAEIEELLFDPLVASLADFEGWAVESWQRDQATKKRLTELFAGDTGLLFSFGHGMVHRAGSRSQLADEGGLLCYDWPGSKAWQGRIPHDHYFSAIDVDRGIDYRGLISVLYACNSAGTPRLDSFSRAFGDDIKVKARRDFIAALPKRLLGHRKPALAVLGHVDGVWPLSFRWSGVGSQIGHFEALCKELMCGRPIGLAMEALGQRASGLAGMIADEQEREREGKVDRKDPLSVEEDHVYLWTAHNDARSYLLLGDPAVRLAVESVEIPSA